LGTDGNGLPLAAEVSAGQRHESLYAEPGTVADVADVFHCGPVVDQVVIQPALGAQSTPQDALEHNLIRHLDQQDRIDVVALQEEFGLGAVTRKAIENEAEIPVVLIQAGPDHFLDNTVRHQLSRRDEPLDARAELGMALDMPAEDIAHADVREVQLLLEQLGLSPLPAALDPHDDVLVHDELTLASV
jgi:hypothetical protein